MNQPGTDGIKNPLIVEVLRGAGVVDRGEDFLLVIPSFGNQQLPHVHRLIDICAHRTDPSGRARARAVAALLAENEPEAVPGFLLMLGRDIDVTLIAAGDVEVTAIGTEQHTFSGRDALAWIERRIAGVLVELRVSATGDAETPSAIPFDLRLGRGPGGKSSAHEPAQEPALEVTGVATEELLPGSPDTSEEVAVPATVPAKGRDPIAETVARPVYQFDSVLLGELGGQAGPTREPLPLEGANESAAGPASPEVVLVEGINCPSGHFNDPAAQECMTCGVALDGRHAPRLTRPRPALGVLVTDTGSVFSVIGDYVIGRAPERDDDVLAGRAQALVLRDVGQSVSRVHAKITVSGWQTHLVDRGSANGTFVSRGGQVGPWERVSSSVPTRITPGTRLRIGERQVLFERYHEDRSSRPGR